MIPTNSSRRGFALLMSLLVVGAVASITIAVIELSIKQVQLTSSTRDSELAFHAANAGVECIHYAWRLASTSFENRDDTRNVNCINGGRTFSKVGEGTATGIDSVLQGSNADLVRYESDGTGFQWLGRCTQVDMLIIAVPDTATGNTVVDNADIQGLYPGYTGPDKVCAPGARCVVGVATGYNKTCNNLTRADTVRREILLEF